MDPGEAEMRSILPVKGIMITGSVKQATRKIFAISLFYWRLEKRQNKSHLKEMVTI
jgi:hypothetical protein